MYSCRKVRCADPFFSSTGSMWVPSSSDLFSSRKILLSSSAEIVSAFRSELAITLISLARVFRDVKIINPAATRSKVRHFIAFSSASFGLEIKTGFKDQGVGVWLEATGVDLRVESVRVRAAAVAIHEVTFNFQVPEPIQVNSPGDDFIVIVIGGQAGVGCRRIKRGECASHDVRDRVARVVGPDLKPFANLVSAGDVPTTNVAEAFGGSADEFLVAPIAAILGIDPQSAHGVLSVKLIGPVGFRSLRVRYQPCPRVEWV